MGKFFEGILRRKPSGGYEKHVPISMTPQTGDQLGGLPCQGHAHLDRAVAIEDCRAASLRSRVVVLARWHGPEFQGRQLSGLGGVAQERDDFPTLRLGKVSERRHTTVQRPVSQNPEQCSRKRLAYLRLIEGWRTSSSFTIRAVAGSAFASI